MHIDALREGEAVRGCVRMGRTRSCPAVLSGLGWRGGRWPQGCRRAGRNVPVEEMRVSRSHKNDFARPSLSMPVQRECTDMPGGRRDLSAS